MSSNGLSKISQKNLNESKMSEMDKMSTPTDKFSIDENSFEKNKLIFSESYKNLVLNYLYKTVVDKEYFISQREFDKHIEKLKQQKLDLIENINKNIIGNDCIFSSPFRFFTNNRTSILITYCDYIASGKPLVFIEDYLRSEVLPTYANTHTTSSFTAVQTSHFRNESRELIGKFINSNENDVILFEGSGSTCAIHTLISCLNIFGKLNTNIEEEIPVVFVSPYEHHSNILPWREVGAIVVQIIEDIYGNLNLNYLEKMLKKYRNGKRLLIGSFSAGSNVTGVLTDCDKVSQMCHENGAICFFDYAAIAPYVAIDMNPKSNILAYKDAIFISPHKLIGGPGTPGLLIAKKHLFKNKVPNRPGGGTVDFVDSSDHMYTHIIEEKEEGGTPDIIGSIRCALAFKLKNQVGCDLIYQLEEYYTNQAYEFWSKNPNIILLGPGLDLIRSNRVKKLAFFSFLIKHNNYYLHPSFVSILLNDLFGIQTRAGCSCAGPYGQKLLGVDENFAKQIKNAILETSKIKETNISLFHMKFGWTRLNFNYFFGAQTFDYILKSVDFLANHGWKLLPLYEFDPIQNNWIFRSFIKNDKINYSLKYIKEVEFFEKHKSETISINFKYNEWLIEVNRILEQSIKFIQNDLYINHKKDLETFFGEEKYGIEKKFGYLRWFLISSESLMEIKGFSVRDNKVAFIPISYPTSLEYLAKNLSSKRNIYFNPCN
jgi:selenocysteine lyase/cysteine desulfurase